MYHISTTPFGRRAVSAGLLAGQAAARAPAPLGQCDKWQVFQALTQAQSAFGLGRRELSVLNALLSFHPNRALVDGDDLIVFPSNASLAARLHGMPESTLRRHLARLIDSGMITRHDSPNGKRYATRGRGGDIARAFGFSLRPLLVQAEAIFTAAEAAAEAAESLRLAREDCVLHLRDASKLLDLALSEGTVPQDSPLIDQLDTLRKALRRTFDPALGLAAKALSDLLHHHLNQPQIIAPTAEMSVCDSQNERHYQKSKPYNNDSDSAEKRGEQTEIALPLPLVVKACPDILPYAMGEIRDWHGLLKAADFAHGMMGITAQTWEEAKRLMGLEQAAITLAAMLQRVTEIQKPGAYLRKLSHQAMAGQFSASRMIKSLLNRPTPCPA